MEETNVEQVEKVDIDTKMDAFLNKTDESGDSTTETVKPVVGDEDTPAEESKDTETKSPDFEGKLAKIKEILGDDEEAINAYIKQQGFHKHPAWQKLLEKSKAPKEVPQDAVEAYNEVKNTINDPEWIRFRMEKQGYKDEAIDGYLKSKGFEVKGPEEDEMAVVARRLGMRVDQIPEGTREIVSDVARIADALIRERFEKFLPEQLKPLKETVDSITSEKKVDKILSDMKAKVEKDSDLSWAEDIEPLLNSYADKNPNCTIDQIHEYFKEAYPELRVERIKLGKRKESRDGIKKGLKVSDSRVPVKIGKPSLKRTGNIEADMDAFIEASGYRE